jgi:branched-subunit amino acid ABC-type transport system permease component
VQDGGHGLSQASARFAGRRVERRPVRVTSDVTELRVDSLIQGLLNGLVLGLIYVAIAVGLTIVFGTLRLVNFAHGAFYAIGAYVGLIVAERLGLVAGLIVAPLAVALFAVLLDRVVLRSFYDKEPTSQILLTFGIALVVQESLRLIFGGATRQFPIPAALTGTFVPLQYPLYRLLFAAGVVLMLLLVWLFLERTDYGLIVRAGIRDRTMVQLLGGNIRRASTIVFALGAAVAGLVGVAASPIYSVDPNTGFEFLVPSFVVVVVGGLGSFWGAVLGGLLIGELQSVTTIYFPPAANVVIYLCMALVLVLRPQGLLGESEVIRQS